MKSIRKDLFECLDKHGEQTMDDLVTRIDGYTRGQLSNNIQAARKEELIASRRDDVTGGPCYKLTPAGKDRLKEIRQKACVQEKPKSETQSPLASTRETQKPIELRAVDIAVNRYNEAAELRAKLALAEKQRDEHFATAEALENKLKATEETLSEKHDRLETLEAELGHYRIQIAALNEQLMAGEEAVDVKDAAKGYLVCAPKRKPAKLMKAESAVARAKSAAKATGRCEVFALVPVGVATRKRVQSVEFKERAA